jgi:hypothetical protein
MSLPVDNPADGFNPESRTDGQRVIGLAGPDPVNQYAVTPDSTANEAEMLLDIDGLLEIAKLISEVRKEGRLGKC